MVSILFVCTGNICRSPMAEGFTKELLQAADADVHVSSSGVIGWEGSGASPEAVDVVTERGVDISGHEARRLDRSQVDAADLIVCMAAEHLEAVLRQVPEAEPKTFTLKELVRLLEQMPSLKPEGEPAQMMRRRVAAADQFRASGFAGNLEDEDITDPLGMGVEMFRAVAWDLEEWCGRLVDALLGRTTVPSTGEAG
jgi:protein-tyrosine-phosphatase